MSAERRYGAQAIHEVLLAHVAACGVVLRSEPPRTVEGELVYTLVCPRCKQAVASVILERPRVRP